MKINAASKNIQLRQLKALSTAVLIALSSVSMAAETEAERKPIGDLEIYAPAKPGTATLFMMLDISGSMGVVRGYDSISTDYGKSCGDNYNEVNSAAITPVVRYDDDTVVRILDSPYKPMGCIISNKLYLDRLSRLQIALIELLADDVYEGSIINESKRKKDKGSLADNYEIGVGAFSYNGNGRTGTVLVPTKPLSREHRIELIKEIAALKAVGGTPTPHALAESGAYMMGTTTADYPKLVGDYNPSLSKNKYRTCTSNYNTVSYDNNSDLYVYACRSWSSQKSSISSSSYNLIAGNYYYKYDNTDSGFFNSTPESRTQNSYNSPLNFNECSGNGIYLLTDGEPNGSTEDRSKAVMNRSLEGSSLSVNSCSGLSGGNSAGSWGCMAEYAELLRNPNNPGKLPIKTATVGFGKEFNGLTGTRNIVTNGKLVQVTDCDSGTKKVKEDVRNLCKLGERRGDNERKTFGDGGFYYTEESQDIANSVVDFAANLVQIINTSPSGTIAVPNDPYQVANQLPYAYLPMLDPNVASANSIWKGNLKKYSLNEGTLFGDNNSQLFKNVAGELKESTKDLWQDGDFIKGGKVANNDIDAGGVYAKLKTPISDRSSVRNIYVEDFSSSTNTAPVLRKLSVDAGGKPQGFNALVDTVTYSELNKRRLLSFLGYTQVLTAEGKSTDNTTVDKLVLQSPENEVRILGGVVHSTPATISYGAKLDDYGRISDDREDYVVFGSMDGALHIADADSGEETVGIIPRYMLQVQPEALVEDSKRSRVGEPFFGVDAPWLVTADYKYDLKGSKVTVEDSNNKGMFAYGGLRMGGEAFYGINISKPDNPEALFTITKDGLKTIAVGKSSTAGFERLGQVWSKPTAAKIRLKKDDKTPTDVLIFGGGYDMAYEKEDYVAASSNQPAQGNAVYMIDAKSGELLWSMSGSLNSDKNTKVDTMIHSVVAEVTVLDRDNDGLMDHLYVADLGGQLFRVDFENARGTKGGATAVNSFGAKNITRLLNTMPTDLQNRKYAYRFYERPVVSFYRKAADSSNQSVADNGKIYAVVNLISGNRSAPLSRLRSNNSFTNRVYGVLDTDITDTGLFKSGYNISIKNLTESNLVNLSTLGNSAGTSSKKAVQASMVDGTKNGWYYPLTRFDGYNNVYYNKGMGDSVVIDSVLYTTVYNPDKTYGTYSSCAARIVGGSERQLYCLPYGICMDEASKNGTGGFVPVGQGIQELTLGTYSSDKRDKKVLIGTTTLTERIKNNNADGSKNRIDFNTGASGSNIQNLLYPNNDKPKTTGGDGSAKEYIFNERYTLQPRIWYERN